MPNGESDKEFIGQGRATAIWQAIGRVDDRVRKIEAQGCGLRTHQDQAMRDAFMEIKQERKDRLEMQNDLEDKMDKIRNQILFGILVMTVGAVLIQYLVHILR